MVGPPLEDDVAARLPGDRRDDPERLAEPLEHGALLDVELDEGIGKLGQPAAAHRPCLLRAEDDNAELGVGKPLGRLDRRNDAERAVEPACGRNAVEVRPAPHAGSPAAAVQVAGLVHRHLEAGLAQPPRREHVGRVLLRRVARAMLGDRIDLVEPVEDTRLRSHRGNARSTCQPASGNSAITAKPSDHELTPTSTPNRAG